MRSISISIDVFAKIWALRAPGETSESQILARVLSLKESFAETLNEEDQVGFRDLKFGVVFPAGFEIFRNFKGLRINAVARNGHWHLPDGSKHNSLNSLSRAIGAGAENAWANWQYIADNGVRRCVSALRNPGSVSRRPLVKHVEQNDEATWCNDTVKGLRALGNSGSLSDIYAAVNRVRVDAGRSWPISADAIIRRTLEENCRDCDSYKGRADLFVMPEGKGAGFWALHNSL